MQIPQETQDRLKEIFDKAEKEGSFHELPFSVEEETNSNAGSKDQPKKSGASHESLAPAPDRS